MSTDYITVTEVSGDKVTQEQIQRLCNRYYWAGAYSLDNDVLEVACGSGQGLGYLSKKAKSIHGGDFSTKILCKAHQYYGDRIILLQFDATELPFKNNSKDVIIIFEALYYISDVEKFIKECSRVLRTNGQVLIATANKDLYDFNASPYSYKYHGVVDIKKLFTKFLFKTEFFGDSPISGLSLRQKMLRPVKKLVIKLHLFPKTTSGKKLFKRFVFGELVKMPPEIEEHTSPYIEPVKIPSSIPDKHHKVIFCIATLN